ncbi:hypothetical protein QBC33DRAFT_547610 [Phialemonium atrogriseum]|uniref:Uncharacterized protein n=1 Tax=Phialemonium atrogriseum TaxID=1093897 RepID=A0AAJ0BY75_9PEZI|nr:uncharacterized protein QBC33DRAFT_547610 [Phialemonium atrogriseum]KAK1764256.1 hypothetical protein QBC33DRAFT_547610 [Phialemonium atrogriseum]
MSSYSLPTPRRIVISNATKDLAGHGSGNEPAVEVVTEAVEADEIFGGVMKRANIGTITIPATNDGPHTTVAAPGAGVVLPGGANLYFLDLAPGYTTPMHRTVSNDYLIVQTGSPVLITPASSFDAKDGRGSYTETVETVCHPGEVVIQRGAMHALSNRGDTWIRLFAIVFDAKTQKIEGNDGKPAVSLGELWLQ